MIEEILNITFPIFFVLLLGYAAGRANQFDSHQVAGINEPVLKFALPASLFVGTVGVSRTQLLQETPHPFTWEDSVEKFDQLVTGRIDGYLSEDIKDAVRSLESIQVNDLAKLLNHVQVCRESIKSGVPLIDLAAKHSEIARHADRAALERMMDPSNYLGQAGPMIDRVLATRKCRCFNSKSQRPQGFMVQRS
jgi:hypothetical protein